MLRFEDARLLVIEEAGRQVGSAKTITKNVWEALGFVLAQEIRTDRAYPPFDRATRDGYAVRASEAGAGETIRCVGEIKAGDTVTAPLAARSCVQIMTGSAVPGGADLVAKLADILINERIAHDLNQAQRTNTLLRSVTSALDSTGASAQTRAAVLEALGWRDLRLILVCPDPPLPGTALSGFSDRELRRAYIEAGRVAAEKALGG